MSTFAPIIPAETTKMLAKSRRYDRLAIEAAEAAEASQHEELDLYNATEEAAAAVLRSLGREKMSRRASSDVWLLLKHQTDFDGDAAHLLEVYNDLNKAYENAAARDDRHRLSNEAAGFRFGADQLRKAAVSAAIIANAEALETSPAHYKSTQNRLNAIVAAIDPAAPHTRDGNRAYVYMRDWSNYLSLRFYVGGVTVDIDWVRRDKDNSMDLDNSTPDDAGKVPTVAQVRKAARLALTAKEKKREVIKGYSDKVAKLEAPLWMLPGTLEDLRSIKPYI